VREARNLLLECGYDRAAMSELATRVGITTPALYWHFDSKAELYGEVVARNYRTFLEQIRKRIASGTPEERLRALITAFVEEALRDRNLTASVGYRQLRDRVPEDAEAAVRTTELEVVDALKSILRDGCAAGNFSVPDVTTTTFALIGMCEWAYTWFRPNGRLSAHEVGVIYADLAVNVANAAVPAPPPGRYALGK
jgi:AcrR family transcriptional regulator